MLQTENTYRVGFIGIGNMGAPMATNLIRAGHYVTVFDLDEQRRNNFVAEHDGAAADSLTELGKRSQVVITMLPDGRAVRAVALGTGPGSDRLLNGLAKGSTIIDMSSSAPVGTRELEAELAEKGIGLLDAPVSGGVPRAISGNLAIMVGGPAALTESFAPIFNAMGAPIHVGSVGAGHAAKVLNNFVSAAGMAAAAEAVVVGERFGIDPAILVATFNGSTGKNNATENKFNQYILNKSFNSGFALELMVKDLSLTMDVAKSVGVPAELGQATLKVWRDAGEALGRGADHTEISRHVTPDLPAGKKSA